MLSEETAVVCLRGSEPKKGVEKAVCLCVCVRVCVAPGNAKRANSSDDDEDSDDEDDDDEHSSSSPPKPTATRSRQRGKSAACGLCGGGNLVVCGERQSLKPTCEAAITGVVPCAVCTFPAPVPALRVPGVCVSGVPSIPLPELRACC